MPGVESKAVTGPGARGVGSGDVVRVLEGTGESSNPHPDLSRVVDGVFSRVTSGIFVSASQIERTVTTAEVNPRKTTTKKKREPTTMMSQVIN